MISRHQTVIVIGQDPTHEYMVWIYWPHYSGRISALICSIPFLLPTWFFIFVIASLRSLRHVLYNVYEGNLWHVLYNSDFSVCALVQVMAAGWYIQKELPAHAWIILFFFSHTIILLLLCYKSIIKLWCWSKLSSSCETIGLTVCAVKSIL